MSMFVSGSITSTGSFGELHALDRIGIGTKNALRPLHSYRNLDANGVILGRFENPSGESIVEIISENNTLGILQFGDPEDANPGAIQYDHSGNSMRFKTADAERLRISSAGDIGIGITNPTFSAGGGIHLKGSSSAFTSLRISVDSNTGVDFSSDSSGHGYMYNRDNSDLIFGTNNTARIRVKNDGNVGIGSASPGKKFVVETTTDFDGILVRDTNDVVRLFNAGANDGYIQLLHGNAVKNQIHSNGATYFTGGDVAIGHTNPQVLLEVGTGSGEHSHFGAISTTNGQFSGITLGYRESNLNYRKAAIVQQQIGDGAARGHMHFLVDTGNDAGSAVLADSKMMIHGTSGDVGIGTTGPSQKLHIHGGHILITGGPSDGGANGEVRFTYISESSYGVAAKIAGLRTDADQAKGGALAFYTQADNTSDGGTERMRIDASGNVGIGHNAPTELLHIKKSTGDVNLIIESVAGSTTPTLHIKSPSNRTGVIKFHEGGALKTSIFHGTDDSLNFYLNSGNDAVLKLNSDQSIRMYGRAQIDGNLGVGSSSPVDKLTVVGNVTQLDGSPEYHFGTTSATHYNWRMAVQETVDGGFEIASGTQSAGTNAPSDTYSTRFIIAGSSGKVSIGTTGAYGQVTIGNTGEQLSLRATSGTAKLAMYEAGTTRGVLETVGGQGGLYIKTPSAIAASFIGTTVEFPTATKISGSAVSTGSFGHLLVGGSQVTPGGGGSVWTTAGSEIYFNNNVGIGTANPSEILHLYSSTNVEPTLKLESGTTGNQGAQLEFVNSGTDADDNDIVGTIRFKGMNDADEETEYCTIYNRSIDVSNGSEDSEMHFRTITAGTLDTTMILQSGKVGIGNTSPGYFLDVLSTQSSAFSVRKGTYGSMTLTFNGSNHPELSITDASGDTEVQLSSYRNSYIKQGNFGIGETSPDEALHIKSNVSAKPIILLEGTNGSAYGPEINIYSNSSTPADNDYVGQIDFEGNDSGLNRTVYGRIIVSSQDVTHTLEDGMLRLQTMFNSTLTDGLIIRGMANGAWVGIGETNPDANLHIKGSTYGRIKLETTGTNSHPIMFFTNDARTYDVRIAGDTDNFAIYDNTAAAYRFVINPSGNIGIGTTSPVGKLDVRGTVTSSMFHANMSADAGSPEFSFGQDPDTGMYSGGANVLGFSTAGTVRFTLNAGAFSSQTTGGARITPTNGSAAAATFTFNDDTDTGMFRGGANIIGFTTAGTERVRIDASGRVGIGTTNPSTTRRLHIHNTDDTRGIYVYNSSATSYAEIHIQANREYRIGTGGASSAAEAQNRFYVYDATAAAHRFTINSSGNVGVGQTSPSHKLDVSGTGRFTGVVTFADGDQNNPSIRFASEGDTGIARFGGDTVGFISNSTPVLATSARGNYQVHLRSTTRFGWQSDGNLSANSPDTYLERLSAGRIYTNSHLSGSSTATASFGKFEGAVTIPAGRSLRTSFIRGRSPISIDAEGSDIHITGSIHGNSSVDVLGSIRRRNALGSNAGLALLTTSSNHGVGEFYSSGGGLNARIHGGGSSFTLNRFGIGHNAPENGGLDIRANHSLGSFSVGDGSGNIYHRYYVSMSGAFGNGTAHHVPRGVPGSGTSNFTTHFKSAVGGGTTNHHVIIDGNVGIGTTSPDTKLHLADSSDVYLTLESTHASTPEEAAIKYSNSSTSANYWWAGLNQSDDYSLAYGTSFSGANTRFLVTETGNVGIGTTSPGYPLVVSKAEGAASDFQTNLDLKRTWASGDSTDRYHGLIFSDTNSVNAGIFVNRAASHANYNSSLHFYTNGGSSNMTPATALTSTPKMSITSTGNVAIGVASTDANSKFQVEGTNASNQDYIFRNNHSTAPSRIIVNSNDTGVNAQLVADQGNAIAWVGSSTGGTNRVVFKSGTDGYFEGGNFGINQSSPSYELDISAASGNVEARLFRNANVKSSLRFQNSVQHWEIGNSVVTNNQFAIYDQTNSRELLTLSSAGAVFNEGSANVDFRVETNNNANTLFIKGSNDRVGIGTNAPQDDVHIKNGNHSGGHAFGSKALSLTTSYNTNAQLTINLTDHNGCYVKAFISGDWSSHSTIAYLGEFFLQNGAGGYQEPGMIIRQVDNTHDVDSVEAQIVDPTDDNFTIQWRLDRSTGGNTATGFLQYEVMGQFNSIT